MPIIGLLHLLIGIGFAYHAHQTGRPQFWMFILLFMPVVGPLAYVLIELIPEALSGRTARKVSANIGNLVDPDKEWRNRHEAAINTNSVETKKALAEECERRGMWSEAIQLYKAAANGVFKDDQALLIGLARAQLSDGDPGGCEETLMELRKAHPDISNQEAHLLYARALEAQNRIAEATDEYESLAGYYAGFEARVRYALLFIKMGNPARAKSLLNEVVRVGKSRKQLLLDADKEWFKIAKSNL